MEKNKKFIIEYTDLMKEWDWKKNKDLDPSKISRGSSKRAWWICSKCNYNWNTLVVNRTSNHSCPQCAQKDSGYKLHLNILKKKGSLYDNHIELMKEWDYKKNNMINLNPRELTSGTLQKAWWKCSKCGYKWFAAISSRTKGIGCPQCARNKVKNRSVEGIIKNRKSLKDNFPELEKEWDYAKNSKEGLEIDKVTSKSGKKAWWICSKCGNSWKSTIASRTDNHGCPFCSGRLVIKGKTDLKTLFPNLAEEWHPKNKLNADEVSPYSGRKVWWIGKCNHEWQAIISNRANGSGCPYCKSSSATSFPEQAFYFYLKQIYKDTVSRDMHLGIELDIYIPSVNLAIEYDGEAWHKGKKNENDKKKNIICKDNNIRLIRIREQNLDEIDNCIVFIRKDTYTDDSLEKIIKEVFNYLKLPTNNINIKKDTGKIIKQYEESKEKKSLAECYPEIAYEWNYEKNGDLTPDKISKGSRRIVWWKGKCGHEWEMSVDARTHIRKNGKAYNCPFCASKRILVGGNDLATLFPELVKEWNYNKNSNKPSDYLINSNQKVWWMCSKGHEWEAKIQSRTERKSGCPYCANKKVLKGYNDLETLIPQLALDWNYEKNIIKPCEVTCGSYKEVWWKCQNCNYEWVTHISSRAGKRTKCPMCKYDIYK